MYLRSVLLSLCYALPLARADFLILTDRPELATATMADSRTSDFNSRISDWAEDQATPLIAAMSELKEFAETATYSIPPVVTELPLDFGDMTIYTTVPEWYSALPTAVKEFHEEEASVIASAYDAANGAPGARAGVDTTATIAAIAAITFSFVVVLL